MYRKVIKKLLDLILALILVILLSPLMIIISIMIKIDSKGPVIFKQIRSGKNNKNFTLYKFRSMTCNNNLYDTSVEDQVTKIGRILRKTSLDELPQLFNIFMGTLSFVGPRPITEEELTKNFSTYQQEQLMKVKPGLTGYWQVMDRSEATYETGKRQQEELAYLPKRSFWFDLKIMFMTIPAVIKGKGAR